MPRSTRSVDTSRRTRATVTSRPITADSDASSSNRPAADQPHQEEYDGDHQENPDEVPEGVTTDHPQQPQHDEDDRNRLEHVPAPPFRASRARASAKVQ